MTTDVLTAKRRHTRRPSNGSPKGRLATLAQQRFAFVQNEFRRFGMDIVVASAAITLLFENFTAVFVGRSV